MGKVIYKGKEYEVGKPRKIPGVTRPGKKKSAFQYSRGSDGKVRIVKSGEHKGKPVGLKIDFGDASMSDFTQHKNEKRRKNFHSRHNCAEKKDKTKPGYWACKNLW